MGAEAPPVVAPRAALSAPSASSPYATAHRWKDLWATDVFIAHHRDGPVP